MKRKVFLIVFLILITAFLSWFYRQKYTKNNRVESEVSLLKLGYIPIADCAQLYVAIEKDFFRVEGLNVETIKFAGGSKIIEALVGGSIDIGFSNLVSLILTRNGGLDIVAIAGGPIEDANHLENAIIVLNKSNVKTAKDLAGKKIAVNTRKNIVELGILEYLEKYGVETNSIQIVEIPFPNMQSVLGIGQVDAIATIEPYKSFTLQDENYRLLSNYMMELRPRTEMSSYNASEKWIGINKEKVAKFKKAMNSATKYCLENPEEVRTILSKYTSLTKEQLAKVNLPTFGYSITESDLQSLIERVYSRGWINQKLPAKSLIY